MPWKAAPERPRAAQRPARPSVADAAADTGSGRQPATAGQALQLLIELAQKTNPAIAAASSGRGGRQGCALAHKSFWPDFQISAQLRRSRGGAVADPAHVFPGCQLQPAQLGLCQGESRPPVQAQAQLEAAEAGQQSNLQQVDLGVAQRLPRPGDRAAQTRLHPRATAAAGADGLRLALSGYASNGPTNGGTGFSDLLTAQSGLRDTELSLIQAQNTAVQATFPSPPPSAKTPTLHDMKPRLLHPGFAAACAGRRLLGRTSRGLRSQASVRPPFHGEGRRYRRGENRSGLQSRLRQDRPAAVADAAPNHRRDGKLALDRQQLRLAAARVGGRLGRIYVFEGQSVKSRPAPGADLQPGLRLRRKRILLGRRAFRTPCCRAMRDTRCATMPKRLPRRRQPPQGAGCFRRRTAGLGAAARPIIPAGTRADRRRGESSAMSMPAAISTSAMP